MIDSTIGWIGVGAMGYPMAKRLLDHGYTVYVLDRPSKKTQEILREGAKAVFNVLEMAKHASCIFSMIPKAEVLLDAAGQIAACGAERKTEAVIDMSTLSPIDSLHAAEILAQAQVAFLRAPVTGSTSYAAAGTLGIMASGPRALFDEAMPLLRILGNRQSYLGETEQARYYKLAINMLLGNIMQAFSESLVFGEKAGLDYATLIDLIADSAAAAPMIRYKAENLKRRDFSPMSVAFNTDKDMGLALEVAEQCAAVLPMSTFTRQMFVSMRTRGLSDADMCALLLLNEQMSGISTGELEKLQKKI